MAYPHHIKPLPFGHDATPGISQQVNAWHHDTHYAGYVKKRNEIEEKLEKADRNQANANYSEYGELKRRETFNASGQILHELYWDMLGTGGARGTPQGRIAEKMSADFGSAEKWQEDFIACAKAALGWAILCYDPSDGRLHNYLVDYHNNGAVWGARPLLAIDVFEHAYYHDYGPDRAKYVEAYLNNVAWEKVDKAYQSAVKS